MPRALDPMWEYGDPEEGTTQNSFFSNYVGHVLNEEYTG
jgi:hypothetical protein